jgi:hypothetical protein
MAIEIKFYVLTEEELKALLKKQRMICFLTDSNKIPDAETPNLPPLLDEWQIIHKITRDV